MDDGGVISANRRPRQAPPAAWDEVAKLNQAGQRPAMYGKSAKRSGLKGTQW